MLTATQALLQTRGQNDPHLMHTKLHPTMHPARKEPPRPNTQLHYPVFTAHHMPMPAGPLNIIGWRRLTLKSPDHVLVEALLGICQFGARIGHERERGPIHIHPNLSTAEEQPAIITAEIMAKLKNNRLRCYPCLNQLPEHFTALALGLVDKADGSKRLIHHLSFPADCSSPVNGGIPEAYGAISYSTIDEAVVAIRGFGRGCQT